MEGFNERTTASVPIQDCLNRGVHPKAKCQKRAKCILQLADLEHAEAVVLNSRTFPDV